MNYDVISYVLIGSFFIAIMIPLVALLRKSIREEKSLGEGKNIKKPETPQPQAKTLIYHS